MPPDHRHGNRRPPLNNLIGPNLDSGSNHSPQIQMTAVADHRILHDRYILLGDNLCAQNSRTDLCFGTDVAVLPNNGSLHNGKLLDDAVGADRSVRSHLRPPLYLDVFAKHNWGHKLSCFIDLATVPKGNST